MICEYTIRITGNQDILVLSPQIIGRLIEKIRCSDTKELIIPADELLPQGYAEYLERVMQTNNIEKNIGRQDAYDLTAKQIGMLKVKRQQCFDKAKAETTENATQFNLETNESFFLLTKQSDSRFVCDYENGEKIVVSLDHFSIWWQTFINKRTVEILIKSLKVSQEVEDLLVYPIVYNARHSIELSLKIVIKMLWELERKKKISHLVEFIVERKKKLHTHNIEELYKMACENKNIDRRIPAYFENIEDMIQFYYFDEEGDAFKYELNKDDQPHMIKNKISHISIELLETEFKAVMEKFDDLIYFLGSCVDEYSLGTFTKSLSRTDIGEISKKLPFYEEWRTEKFKEVKDQIKQEYQLGSKELTDALNLIKKHRLFSSNIGCERMFGTITEDELKEYASLVKYYWEKDKSKEKVVIAWDDLAEIQQNAKILKNYLSKILIETLNTLLCFYEIGNSNLTVEKLENTYKYIVDSEFDEMYIIRKLKQKNACLRIIVGMKKCGQVTYEKQMQAALKEEKVEL